VIFVAKEKTGSLTLNPLFGKMAGLRRQYRCSICFLGFPYDSLRRLHENQHPWLGPSGCHRPFSPKNRAGHDLCKISGFELYSGNMPRGNKKCDSILMPAPEVAKQIFAPERLQREVGPEGPPEGLGWELARQLTRAACKMAASS
jgi:hypothetical protein